MSVAAPAKDVGRSSTPREPLTPERRERLLFARIMILVIVPLYFLILLTFKAEARYRIAQLGEGLDLDMTGFIPYARAVYHGLIILACAATPLYCLLGAAKLAIGRAGWRHVVAAGVCVLVGVAEAAAIALAIYRYKVAL